MTPVIARRVRPAIVMAGGLLLATLGFVVVGQVAGPGGLATLVAGFAMYSLGLAPVFTLATDMIIASAPPERAGAAAAISETGSEFGGALGIAVLGSIGTAVYRAAVGSLAQDVSAADVAAARNTLGGAVAVAERLPDFQKNALLETARAGFTEALQLVSLVSAGVVFISAVLAVVLLRNVGDGTSVAQ